ncbi:hypothetical protein diail_2385 [Diaporthe ilicicola]|nr:hypothetical protein diail_2385 [Diaporthe ilicicola]
MLRGRRLPLPQSPLSRWRTTAPATGLRRATETAAFFSTTARRLNDDDNHERPVARSDEEHGQARQGAKSRLRIHKIGVYGDDWALLHAKRDAEPWNQHVRLSLQGSKPFGDRYLDDQRNLGSSESGNTHLRWKSSKRRDAPREVGGANDYYLQRLQIRHEEAGALEGAQELQRPRPHGNTRNEVTKKEHPPHRFPEYQERPRRTRQGIAPTAGFITRDLLRERLLRDVFKFTEDEANLETDGFHNITSRETPGQASDEPLPKTDRPQGLMAPRAGFESSTKISPSVQEAIARQYQAIARQYRLATSEKKPLFSPRPLEHHGESFVATADAGPAESLQKSRLEDPVLKKAKLLASPLLSLQTPTRLEMHTEPRFRLTPSWKPILEPFKHEAKTSQIHMNELQVEAEAKPRKERHPESTVNAYGVRSGEPEATSLEGGKSTKNVELMAVQDKHDTPTSEGEGAGASNEGTGLAESAQSTDNRSIFEKLFGEQERTKDTDRGELAFKLRSAYSAAERRRSDAKSRQIMPEMPQGHDQTTRQGVSIFSQLFPEHVESGADQKEQETPGASLEQLRPPEDSVLISLRNEVRNWMSKVEQQKIKGPRPKEYGSHSTVVVISGTSPSLIDTDFYRIAPEGQHVEGWAGGLLKVIQARDSISYEPLGQYYLMFHSRPSALAYVDEVRRLHELSRKLLHAPADSGREVAKGSLDQAPTQPQPFLNNEEKAAVRSFTLYPPSITPKISVRMWNTTLVEDLAAKSNIADILPTLRPEGSTPARVLLKLTSPDVDRRGGAPNLGGGLTTDELWLMLRDDGRERSAPWLLANLSEGIMPIKPRFLSEHYKIAVRAEPVPVPVPMPLEREDDADALGELRGEPVVGPLAPEGGGEGVAGNDALAAGVDRNERFNRFVLTFTQPAIARRFVRCWHKRVVYDGLLDRSLVVDAVAIM